MKYGFYAAVCRAFDFVFLFAFDKLTLSISDETEIDKGFWIQK